MAIEHPLIQITDERDIPLRGGTMDEAQLEGLWHRVTGVMVKDSRRGLYLLQKIAPNPYYNGGKWNLSSTGHVDEGESYEDAAIRELTEEMGVTGLELIEFDYYPHTKEAYRAGKNRIYRRYYKIYTADVDSKELVIAPNEAEVEDTVWMSSQQLQSMGQLDSPPMTETLLRVVDKEFHGGN